MAEVEMRVALLARAGNARDQLRRALADLGADVVAEGDPSELDPAQVASLRPTLVLISLEPAIETAIDRFDDLLATPGVDVMFDDAEVTRHLDGWDLNRWARHLAAKLMGTDVLPPPPQETVSVPESIDTEIANEAVPNESGDSPRAALEQPDEMAADLPLPSFGLDVDMAEIEHAVSQIGVDAETGQAGDWVVPKLVTGPADDEFVLDADLEGFDQMIESGTSTANSAAAPADAGVLLADIDFDAQPDGFSRFGSNDELPVNTLDADVAALAAQLDALSDNDQFQHTQPKEPDFSRAAPDLDFEEPPPAGVGKGSVAAEAVVTRQNFDFSSLSLTPMDEVIKVAAPVAAQVVSPSVAGRVSLTLETLPDELGGDGRAASRGALLILAGLGGPDAVRQLLKALPGRLPVPVLLCQHLEVGNHDRLVAQLAKVSPWPVYLATGGMRAQPGQVAVMPQGLGVKVEGDALAFAPTISQSAMIESLPAADSMVFVLSGTDPEAVPAALALMAQGGTVMAQNPAACFDAVAAQALVGGGAPSGDAAVLAQRFGARWA